MAIKTDVTFENAREPCASVYLPRHCAHVLRRRVLLLPCAVRVRDDGLLGDDDAESIRVYE
jgi:hypothetical protein